jgi:hypothetical protein
MFRKTFVPFKPFSLASLIGTTPSFSTRILLTSSSSTPMDTVARSAKFFTNPQFCPSGLSTGHSMPQWVACSSLASKCG